MQMREHYYQNERLIYELDSKEILQIVASGSWKTLNQSISSAETNNDNNEEPKKLNADDNTCGVDAFADLKFDENTKKILDVGGGKFDCCVNFMKKRNVQLLVWDPYNRSHQHNLQVENSVKENKVDAATSMAVLNVIPEPEVRLAHAATLKEALKIKGVAYFKIWPGEGALRGSYKPTVNSYGYPGFQANSFPDRFLREIQIVFGIDNVEIHKSIPNLIVAKKISEHLTSLEDIQKIQELSKKDTWQFTCKNVKPVFFNVVANVPSENKTNLRSLSHKP